MKKILYLKKKITDITIPDLPIPVYLKVLIAIGRIENEYFFATAKRVIDVLENGGHEITSFSVRNHIMTIARRGYVKRYNGNPGKYVLTQEGANLIQAFKLTLEEAVSQDQLLSTPTTEVETER